MKFVIVGTGAIGGYYGARLCEAGHEVVFVARGPHLDAIRRHGLEVSHPEFKFARSVTACDLGDLAKDHPASGVDALFLCVKTMATAEVALALRFWVRRTPLAVVSLQNGVDNEAILAKHLENAWIIGGVARRIGGEITVPGKIEVRGVAEVLIGAWPDKRSTPVEYHTGVEVLGKQMNEAGIPTTLSDNIQEELWRKLVINNGVNPLSALTELDTHALVHDEDLGGIVKKIMLETVTASRALGLGLSSKDADDMFSLLSTFDAIKTSMHIDLENGRQLEIDAISDPVIARARELGISAPVTETVAALLRHKLKIRGQN